MGSTKTVLKHETALKLIGTAVMAPSSHNTQPWLFRIRGDRIGLIADRTRALPANDPHDRELTISCACALFNLRVAAAQAQLAASLHSPTPSADPDCLAVLELTPTAPPDAVLATLYDAVATRRTYRKTFATQPVTTETLATLAEAARLEGAWLHVLASDVERRQAVELIAEGDEMQWGDPAWRRELASWMHPRRDGDGLALPGLAVPLAQAVVRTFDMGHGVGARDLQLADASPVLAVIGTAGDTPADWMVAGQAMQRLLLTACLHGLQASFLNQPIEVAPLRSRLRQLTGQAGFPQILLRLGYPDGDVPAAPRRPLDAVIEFIE